MSDSNAPAQQADKKQSLLALDSTNFFLADVETGIGPFIATYLSAANHWNPAQVGLVNGTQNLATVLVQAPAGWLLDNTRRKTWWMAACALVLAIGSVFVVHARTVPLQVLNQAAVGAALAVLLPGISAVSLGLVGKALLSPRVGRNAMFTHIGNTVTAVAAGYLARQNGQAWIFYMSAVLGCLAVASILFIREKDIDNEAARAKESSRHDAKHAPLRTHGTVQEQRATLQGRQSAPLLQVLAQPAIYRFLLLVIVFHMANASLLPLTGQHLSQRVHGASGTYMAACILVGQMVMIPVAFFAGKLADRTGRKPLFLIAFTALLSRAALFAATDNPFGVVAIEALDGIGTALAGVTTVLIIADLVQGTGRFNVVQGCAQAALGAGAFLGKLGSGWVAKLFGFTTAFASLAAVALLGLLLFWTLVKETATLQAEHA